MDRTRNESTVVAIGREECSRKKRRRNAQGCPALFFFITALSSSDNMHRITMICTTGTCWFDDQ